MKHLLLILLIVGCNSTPQKVDVTPDAVVLKPVVVVPDKAWKTPTLLLPSNPSIAMLSAVSMIAEYGNSDEFYEYVRLNVKTLAGGNETDINVAIAKFRNCLDKGETISITWYSYRPFSNVIGGWSGYSIVQNPKMNMTSIERAGHWLHEISHYCNFSHVSNNISTHPIIKQSFSYQAGYKFESFLNIKHSNKVANQ